MINVIIHIRMKVLKIVILICLLSMSAQAQRRYLLFSNENIARLKSQINSDEQVKSAWEEQLSNAEKQLERDHIKASECPVLALAYRMTSDERFAEAIKKTLFDYTSKETWEGRDLLSREPAWRGGLNTSHTSFYLAIGYDCIYEYLSKKERKDIAAGLVHTGIEPLRNDWLNPESNIHTFDTMGHNWWSACVCMAGFASLAVREEVPEAKKWVKDIAEIAEGWVTYSGSILQNKIPNFDRDGGFYESINYASYGLSQYLLFRYAFGQIYPEAKQAKLEQVNKTADFFIYTTYYRDDEKPLSVNFGDGNMYKNGNSCVLLLWNMGLHKERYAWYLNKVNSGDDKEGLQLNTPVGLILHPDLPEIADDYTPDLELSHLYQDMGWATLRNSWNDNATMLAVKSGLTWNHSHADAGSYILFHNGRNLIIDPGNASYGNPLYTEYYCQSEAHNVVLFNGEGQNRKDPYFGSVNNGSLHNLIEGTNFKYLLANATGPYSQILSRNYRSFIWVRDVILVIDDLLAHEPGQFEWLLHYNGESRRRGLDLSIKQDEAEVLVRPLFPETFPNGGLPHDFPEKMRLEEKLGYADHKPDVRLPYWSISQNEKTERTKCVSAIILKTEANKDNLPVIERFQGNDYLSVRITQNGETTEVYLNLLADGRIKHRNSIIEMNGWKTDSYLFAVTFGEGADISDVKNIKQLFVGHGSYVRRDDKTLIHCLSKYTALVEDFNTAPKVEIDAQNKACLRLLVPKKSTHLLVNKIDCTGEYEPDSKTIKVWLDK